MSIDPFDELDVDYNTPPKTEPHRQGMQVTINELAEMLELPIPVIRKGLTQLMPTGKTSTSNTYALREAIPHLADIPEISGTRKELKVVEVDGKAVETWRLDMAKEVGEYYRSLRIKIQLDLDSGAVLDKDITLDLFATLCKSLSGTLDGLPDTVDRAVGLEPKVYEMLERTMDDIRNTLHEELVLAALAHRAVQRVASATPSGDSLERGKRLDPN